MAINAKLIQQKDYKVLDLFAGCGGMSKGFDMAGFNIVVGSDIWEPASKTYIRNHETSKFVLGDITDEQTRDHLASFFEETPCDVIIGGPPCQAYSMSGHRDVDDSRGRLFEDYVKLVDVLRPRVFVMENVKGILSMRHDRDDLSDKEVNKLEELKNLEKERASLVLRRKQSKNTSKIVFTDEDQQHLDALASDLAVRRERTAGLREKITDRILKRFRALGYTVEFKVLNAADYGVPQKRERVIFIGTRLPISIRFPEPTHKPAHQQQDVFNSHLQPWATVRGAIDDLKNNNENKEFGHLVTKHSDEFVQKIRETPIGKSVFGGYSDAFFKNPPDEPSRTVKENHGGVLVHYEQDRVMTPRELARLQSFPDDFAFEGTKSTILKQIGNAVPPQLAKAIGRAVEEMLEEAAGCA